MPSLLNLEIGPRGDRSISRALGRRFVERWKKLNPDGRVISRDLNASRIPYMDNDWIAGVYAPPDVVRTPEMEKALALPSTRLCRMCGCVPVSGPHEAEEGVIASIAATPWPQKPRGPEKL